MNRGEISLWENWDPLKKHDEKNQNGMENSNGNADKKNYENRPKWSNKGKTLERVETKKKGNMTRKKQTIQLEEINQKVLAKKGRLKRYRWRVKQNRQKRIFQNNERKFYEQAGGDDTKSYQQLDVKETERFWTKIWQLKT